MIVTVIDEITRFSPYPMRTQLTGKRSLNIILQVILYLTSGLVHLQSIRDIQACLQVSCVNKITLHTLSESKESDVSHDIFWVVTVLIILLLMDVYNAIWAARNPNRHMDWINRKYAHRLTSDLSDEEQKEMLSSALIELKNDLTTIRSEIDDLLQQKEITRKQVLALVDGIKNFGLAKSNRVNVASQYILGIVTGIISSYIYALLTGS